MSSRAAEGAPTYAAVDLGTNTFHVLIGRWVTGRLEQVYRERHFVKIAEDGIGTVGAGPAGRAREAARSIGEVLRRYKPTESRAYGTAALRTASNGPALREELSELLGVDIALIDGIREAELIAKGVLAAGLPTDRPSLIMDIGGGSVEFIAVSEAGAVGFSVSLPLGAQVLKQRFHTREPFAEGTDLAQERELFGYLAAASRPVTEYVAASATPYRLVGASGTFDVLADLFGEQVNPALWRLDLATVRALYAEVRAMNEEQRLADPRLPTDRADMIVVALGLIVVVADMLRGQFGVEAEAMTCSYALKEGALLELHESE